MTKKHDYEFHRNKKSMRLQYALAFVYHLIMLAYGVVILVGSNQTYNLTIDVVINLSPILFCLKFIALIKIKSHIDILQGVSKLDHLMKVSVF